MKSRPALLNGMPLPGAYVLPQRDDANTLSFPAPPRSPQAPNALECDDDCPFCQGPETD